jgi:hypothetical protein
MKKWFILSGLLVVMVLFGFYMSRNFFVNAQIDDTYVNQPYHCQRQPRTYSYEWVYAHLSTTDQEQVDLEFIRLLDVYDFDALSESDKQTTLTSIKEDLLNYISDEGFIVGRRR